MKKHRHWYPGIVVMYAKPTVVLAVPKGDWDNDQWIKVD